MEDTLGVRCITRSTRMRRGLWMSSADSPILHRLSLCDDAIVSLLIGYTLSVLVRQLQCQVCINHDLATYLADCRTDHSLFLILHAVVVLQPKRVFIPSRPQTRFFCFVVTSFASCLDFISRYSSTVICTVTIALLLLSILPIITDFNKFHIIKALSIRELIWQIKLVVLEATNFTGFQPSFHCFSLKIYEISDLSLQ